MPLPSPLRQSTPQLLESITKMSSPLPGTGATTKVRTTASLGKLAHFPIELRLEIYELVAASDQTARTPHFHRICKRGSVLSSLSKEIRHESKKVIDQAVRGPCQHKHFKILLPTYAESANRHHTLGLLEAQLPFGTQHEAKNVESMHFVTAHLGRNVPLNVIIKFRPFGSSAIAVYGASAERTSLIEKEMMSVMRGMEKSFKAGNVVAMRPAKAAGSKSDEIHISDLDAIVEKLRDLVCVDVEEWKEMKEWEQGEE